MHAVADCIRFEEEGRRGGRRCCELVTGRGRQARLSGSIVRSKSNGEVKKIQKSFDDLQVSRGSSQAASLRD